MTDPAKEQPTSERTSVNASFSIDANESYKTPDSATWAKPGATGIAEKPVFTGMSGSSKVYSVSIALPSALGQDPLTLGLWRNGIRLMTVSYKASGSTGGLEMVAGSAIRSGLALDLAKALDSAKNGAASGKAGVDSLLAKWILASDPRAKNWKDSLPEGLNVPGVVRSVLVEGSRLGKPLVELGLEASLSISDDSLKTLVLELISTKAIEAKDSAILFPPAPVRVAVPLSVAGDPKAGGDPVKLGGGFVWNDDLGLVALRYEVKRGAEPSGSVVVSGLPVPEVADRKVSLESASIVALSSAQPGEYTLVVTAADGNGNSASTSVAVQVLAKDPDQPTAPRIRLLSPADKSVVPFETSEVVTAWIVTTPQGSIDSVTVDGAKADKSNDSTWSAKVKLEPTGKARTVVARATNSAGLSTTETASLAREVDKAGPVVEWISPASDVDVENGVNAITARIKAADASGIDTVLIGGQKPDSINAAGEWVRKVPLTVVGSPTAIEVRVVDKAGNASVSSRNVTRADAPTDVPPKVVLVDPVSKTGTVVPFETRSIVVRWTITDPYGIDSASVTVNGVKAKAEPGDKWSAEVDLAAGVATSIILSVKNKNGVSGGDVIAVTRKADTVVSSIELVAGSRSVGFDSAEVVVSCKVAGIDSLALVTIGGVAATNSNGVHSAKVKVGVGDTRVELVARDKSSKLTTSEAIIHRYQKLTMNRLGSSGDTTVPHSTTTLLLHWNIWGSVKVVGAILNQGAYATLANLEPGANIVKVFAVDSAGKLDSLETKITRRTQVSLSLSYGLDTLGTLPDSVVISAASETGAGLAWSLDGRTWTPFTGSFVQKASGTAQVRAQVVGKDDSIASLKAFTLFHANHAPVVSATTTEIVAKSYLGSFSGQVARVDDWGLGDVDGASASGTCEMETSAPVDTTILSNLSVGAKPSALSKTSCILAGVIDVDSSIAIKVRFRVRDNGGTANGGVDLSAWTDWVTVQIVDTVVDRDGNSYRARRMPDGKVWMRSNLMVRPPNAASNRCASSNCPLYGALYTWSEAMGLPSSADSVLTKMADNPTGICPEKWVVPSEVDWIVLETKVGANALKSTTGWVNKSSCTSGRNGPTCLVDSSANGTDQYGYNMLPSTSRKAFDTTPYSIQAKAGFWLSSESDARTAYYRAFDLDVTGSTAAFVKDGNVSMDPSEVKQRSLRCMYRP